MLLLSIKHRFQGPRTGRFVLGRWLSHPLAETTARKRLSFIYGVSHHVRDTTVSKMSIVGVVQFQQSLTLVFILLHIAWTGKTGAVSCSLDIKSIHGWSSYGRENFTENQQPTYVLEHFIKIVFSSSPIFLTWYIKPTLLFIVCFLSLVSSICF